MQRQSKYSLKKFDIIRLPLRMSDFETKSRPVLIEKIVNNHIVYRPITDSYYESQTGETKRLCHNIKESDIPIKNWKESGLKKPSSINIGVRQLVDLDDLPININYYGRLSQLDQQYVPKFDSYVEQHLASIQDKPNTYYKYVTTHNHANKLADNAYELQDRTANTVDLNELNKPITIDFSRPVSKPEPKVKPQSRDFTNRSRRQDKQNRQENRFHDQTNQRKINRRLPDNEPSL